MHEPTIDELLADADALPERGGLGAALDAIRCNVNDDAVSATVNLHGKLVGLEFTEHAMQLPAAARGTDQPGDVRGRRGCTGRRHAGADRRMRRAHRGGRRRAHPRDGRSARRAPPSTVPGA